MDPTYENTLSNLLAKKFIARKSPPALQVTGGGYRPLREETFTRAKLNAHLAREETYGHYIINEEDQCKLFVLDFDLKVSGWLPTVILSFNEFGNTDNFDEYYESFRYIEDLRAEWHNRHNLPGRAYLKRQIRILAHLFCGYTNHYIQCPTAAVYSGNKGFHVYGFTDLGNANRARELGQIMLGTPGYWEPFKGKNFFRDGRCVELDDLKDFDKSLHPSFRVKTFDPGFYFNWSVEIFPKQDSLENKDLGNLVRLPLGVNKHYPADPTFFIDLTSSLNELKPVDPVYALTTEDPFATVSYKDAL